MNGKIEKFSKAVGALVKAVLVEVLFFKDERQGTIGNLIVELADGQRYSFGCRGDGGIFVTTLNKGDTSAPPDFIIELRPFEAFHGCLELVETSFAGVLLMIDNQKLYIKNRDDALEIWVNGKTITQEVVLR